MPKLTDTQTILLSTAAARPEGSVLPAPETLKVKGASYRRFYEATFSIHG